MVNNNLDDLINARPFSLEGDGTNEEEVVELDELFNADHMGYPSNWIAKGWSTVMLGNITYISHASRNLPTVNKKSGSASHTHHGLIVFTNPSGDNPWQYAKWIVRTNPQEYDGGINWDESWTLVTEKSLTFNGEYIAGKAHVSFGSRGADGAAITKQGADSLVVEGIQAYAPGTAMIVQEGDVIFHTDPATQGTNYLNWPCSNPGPYLELSVSNGAGVEFRAATNGLHTISNFGSLTLAATSRLATTATMTLGPSANTQVYMPSIGACVTCGGSVSIQGGDFTLLGTPPIDLTTAISASNITGCFSRTNNAPAGSELLYGTDKVWLALDRDLDGDEIPNAWELDMGLSMTNSNAGMNSDGDALDDFDEYVADTHPTNDASWPYLAIENSGGGETLIFNTSRGRTYSIEYADNPAEPAPWPVLTNGIIGTGSPYQLPVPRGAYTCRVYRLTISLDN